MKPFGEARFGSPFLHTGDFCLHLTNSFIGDASFRILMKLMNATLIDITAWHKERVNSMSIFWTVTGLSGDE